MQIVPYQPTHLPGLYEAYCQTTANVPHCRFIPSLSYIGRALALAEQAGAGLLVAEDDGVVRGVATFRPIAPAADGLPQLEITGCFAPEEATTAALLEACLSRAEGARRIVAFPDGAWPLPNAVVQRRLGRPVRQAAMGSAGARPPRIRTHLS